MIAELSADITAGNVSHTEVVDEQQRENDDFQQRGQRRTEDKLAMDHDAADRGRSSGLRRRG